jgi:hypothetical protein
MHANTAAGRGVVITFAKWHLAPQPRSEAPWCLQQTLNMTVGKTRVQLHQPNNNLFFVNNGQVLSLEGPVIPSGQDWRLFQMTFQSLTVLVFWKWTVSELLTMWGKLVTREPRWSFPSSSSFHYNSDKGKSRKHSESAANNGVINEAGNSCPQPRICSVYTAQLIKGLWKLLESERMKTHLSSMQGNFSGKRIQSPN